MVYGLIMKKDNVSPVDMKDRVRFLKELEYYIDMYMKNENEYFTDEYLLDMWTRVIGTRANPIDGRFNHFSSQERDSRRRGAFGFMSNTIPGYRSQDWAKFQVRSSHAALVTAFNEDTYIFCSHEGIVRTFDETRKLMFICHRSATVALCYLTTQLLRKEYEARLIYVSPPEATEV